MASCDLLLPSAFFGHPQKQVRTYPMPPKPTRATRPAGSEHRRRICSRMSPRSTKSRSREKGMAAKGAGGVSARSRKRQHDQGSTDCASFTWREVDLLINRPVVYPHLLSQVVGSESGLHHALGVGA